VGPVIASRLARKGGLDTSMLERLFSTGAYPDVNAGRDQYRLSPCSYLVENYRSMPSILMAPSGLFYEGSLVPSAKDVQMIKWSGLTNSNVPILFRGCDSDDMTTDEGASWYNEGEIDEVVATIVSLQSERPDIQAKEIAVITPWREQVWRIRARLRGLGLHGVDVGHVESYQGAEFRVTILSCVRSRSRFINADRHAGAGFYDQPKRFNVAITRAKELLVVIGNANLLKGDAHWRGFLQVVQRLNLYSGPKLHLTPESKVSCGIE
jgi:superfamily I DNA and/or RNA helicase